MIYLGELWYGVNQRSGAPLPATPASTFVFGQESACLGIIITFFKDVIVKCDCRRFNFLKSCWEKTRETGTDSICFDRPTFSGFVAFFFFNGSRSKDVSWTGGQVEFDLSPGLGLSFGMGGNVVDLVVMFQKLNRNFTDFFSIFGMNALPNLLAGKGKL